jgi:Spy/CpxP family protein refolding chaperone
MKRVISVFCALLVLTAGAFAQGPQGPRRGDDNGWRERVRSEKVAFLTQEIDLTESEAQVFWPIYNEIQKTQRESFEAVQKAYVAMEKGVQEKKSGKEMEKLVRAYIEAKEKNEGIETKYLNKLLKSLPAEKVARYYVAEEKFRHQQIGRLGNGNFPNFRMNEDQRQQWRERGEQMREQFRNWTGQKKESEKSEKTL